MSVNPIPEGFHTVTPFQQTGRHHHARADADRRLNGHAW